MPKLQTLVLLVNPQSSVLTRPSHQLFSSSISHTPSLSVSQTLCLLHSLHSQPTTANTHPKQPAAQLNHSVSGVCVAAFLASSSPAQSSRSRSRSRSRSSQQHAPCLDVVIFLASLSLPSRRSRRRGESLPSPVFLSSQLPAFFFN
ncbi:hypothetical protein S245_048786 [Arachis hypogaea]